GPDGRLPADLFPPAAEHRGQHQRTQVRGGLMVSLILFGLFVVLLAVNVPIGVALGLASMAALGYGGLVDSSYLAQSLVTSIDSFPLMAVPFFILAGDLMGHGGISRRLLDVGDIFFGRITG